MLITFDFNLTCWHLLKVVCVALFINITNDGLQQWLSNKHIYFLSNVRNYNFYLIII